MSSQVFLLCVLEAVDLPPMGRPPSPALQLPSFFPVSRPADLSCLGLPRSRTLSLVSARRPPVRFGASVRVLWPGSLSGGDWALTRLPLFLSFPQRVLFLSRCCQNPKPIFFPPSYFAWFSSRLRLEGKFSSCVSNMARSRNRPFPIFYFISLNIFISLNTLINSLLFTCNLRLNISFDHLLFLRDLSLGALFLCVFIFALGYSLAFYL